MTANGPNSKGGAAGTTPAREGKPMSRILIVEDEMAMRMALKDCLEAEDYRVLVAADGETGLKRALEEKPDLILLDIMMPRLDGCAVCGELRRTGSIAPVLMLTAKGQVEDRVAGLDAGADDYLVKPFEIPVFLARVAREGFLVSIVLASLAK